MSLDLFEVKKIVITALFADDDLYEKLVLKGGTAMALLGYTTRSSVDIDFSMESEFEESELEKIENKMKESLRNSFLEYGYDVIDCVLKLSPGKMSEEKKKFWGGYKLEFKIVSKEDIKRFERDEININALRQLALVGMDGKKRMVVDISKFEYCKEKTETTIDDFPIYIYTPLMIINEKLRAICQQQSEYRDILGVSITPRARDFFDIYVILESENHREKILKDFLGFENLDVLKEVFNIKNVPLTLLGNIRKYRDFHREDFESVRDTVEREIRLETFDFYFDYVLRVANQALEKLINLDMMDDKSSISQNKMDL